MVLFPAFLFLIVWKSVGFHPEKNLFFEVLMMLASLPENSTSGKVYAVS